MLKLTHNSTCIDRLLDIPQNRRIDTRLQLSKVLFNHGLQITQHTLEDMTFTSYYSIWFADFSAGDSPDPLFNDSALAEATISRSDRQLRRCLRQSGNPQTLDVEAVVYALGLATITGWTDGCKIMLEADVMASLNQDFKIKTFYTLLGSSTGTNRREMVQLWLSHRANFDLPQLNLVGYAEDILDVHQCGNLSDYSKDIFRDVASYLLYLRQEIRLLVEKHEIDLHEILERLVPVFISQFDAVGGRLLDFVVDVMIPNMRRVTKEIRKVARKLREEEEALYAEGRRELGVIMYEDEDDTEQSDSDEEEEGEEWYTEEESDDEY
ncbi:unnamed protein product [Alternaria alternata]